MAHAGRYDVCNANVLRLQLFQLLRGLWNVRLHGFQMMKTMHAGYLSAFYVVCSFRCLDRASVRVFSARSGLNSRRSSFGRLDRNCLAACALEG